MNFLIKFRVYSCLSNFDELLLFSKYECVLETLYHLPLKLNTFFSKVSELEINKSSYFSRWIEM
jgi:hypothetical protein